MNEKNLSYFKPMLILAIDQSSATGSAAILDDQRPLLERRWSETRLFRQQLFPSLRTMLHEAGLDLKAIQLYVVGVGPGSYSGLRVALAAVGAMAIPGKTPVYGVTSAEGLAWQAMQATHATRVQIVGDARRNQWWTRVFQRRDTCVRPVGDWSLVYPETFQIAGVETVATPDWARIGVRLAAVVPACATILPRALLPDAASLGRLAVARMAQGILSERLAPIYLHSAVNAKVADCQVANHLV